MAPEGENDKYRRFVRKPIHVDFRVRDAEDTTAGELMFEAADLSAGGVFLRSEFLLEVDDKVDVAFTLPGTDTVINATARVAWVTVRHEASGEAGMGLEFLELADADRDAIGEFIRQHGYEQVTSQMP